MLKTAFRTAASKLAVTLLVLRRAFPATARAQPISL